ncbi:MAG: sortase B protein-sorting domain-containing protein [Bacteroidota bacterium]
MKFSNNIFLYIILFLIAAFFLVRAPFLLRFFILFIFLGAVFYFLRQLLLDRQKQKAKNNTIAPHIETKLQHCRTELNRVKTEKTEIENSIDALEQQLRQTDTVSPSMRVDSERLIKSYQQELAMRYTKIAFYETCIEKLNALLHNLKLSETIADKQERLKQLQEKNEEDIVSFEELKTAIDFEQNYLNGINDLSAKMLESRSLQDAQAIQSELEALTRELRDL